MRAQTKSKRFYDDEIEFVYPNGDIHLKEGVRRMKYTAVIDPQISEKYINEDIIAKDNFDKLTDKMGTRQLNHED